MKTRSATKKQKQPKYESISRLSSFASNQEAKDHAFSALLRSAKVAAYLADTGKWVVSVTELAHV